MAAIGFTYAQQMLYPVLFQISELLAPSHVIARVL
jgi:hypothetical protein